MLSVVLPQSPKLWFFGVDIHSAAEWWNMPKIQGPIDVSVQKSTPGRMILSLDLDGGDLKTLRLVTFGCVEYG
jgi:hypothetical protein